MKEVLNAMIGKIVNELGRENLNTKNLNEKLTVEVRNRFGNRCDTISLNMLLSLVPDMCKETMNRIEAQAVHYAYVNQYGGTNTIQVNGTLVNQQAFVILDYMFEHPAVSV